MKKVKTAIVGCGMISNIYIRNLKKMFSIIDLVALCDVHAEAAREKAGQYGVDNVMTIDEVADSEEIELVVNLTGPMAHYDVLKKMLLAGKHVYTEKMFTTKLAQAEELVKIAEENNLLIAVAPDTVLGAGIQTAKYILDVGLIGTPTSCLISMNRNQSLNSEVFRFLQGQGGALPDDVGIYFIAAALALLGPVKSVNAVGSPALEHCPQLLANGVDAASWTIPGNNVLAGSMVFENGAVGSVHFNGNTIGEEKPVFRIYGTKGILDLGNPERFDGFVRLTLPEKGEIEIPHTHGYDGTPVSDMPDMIDYAYGHRGIGVAEEAWAIRMGRENRLSKEFGYHAMEVLCGMNTAAETGTICPMDSTFRMRGLESGYMGTMLQGAMKADSERSLVN